MDSVSQAALGAAIGETILGHKGKHKGALVGAIVGTIPDLDIILLPFFDTIHRISIHRGFSHSILFSVLGAFVIMYILKRMRWFKNYEYWRLYLFSFLGLFTHILLDAFTAYGTQLFLPWSDQRVSLDSINIVDPFYTTPLLIGLFGTLYLHRKSQSGRIWNRLGLIVSSAYLMLTLVHKNFVHETFINAFKERNIYYDVMHTVPVKVGNINWYGVARNETTLFMGKFNRLNGGPIQFDSFPINDHFLQSINTELADKMRWFAQDLYVVAENDKKVRIYNLQCDMQGIQYFGDYRAPTAYYFEIETYDDGSFDLSTGMHASE